MLLWITALYNRELGPRWLSCYLDLKTPMGQQMVRQLGESGCYRILFFALEEPPRCANVMTSTIAPLQRQMLQEWANTSQTLVSAAQPQMSKSLLKQEFEKLKPKILIKLESIQTSDFSSDISG
jgi:serine/threonine-protein kinase